MCNRIVTYKFVTEQLLNVMQNNSKPQIHIKRKYKHAIDKVWSALTTKEALSSWLMDTDDFELTLGSEFNLKTTPRGKFDGVLRCSILKIEEPTAISYSWQSNGMTTPTIVTWELKDIGNEETLLSLSHDGFVGFDGWMTKTMLSFGWKKLLKKRLEKHLSL